MEEASTKIIEMAKEADRINVITSTSSTSAGKVSCCNDHDNINFINQHDEGINCRVNLLRVSGLRRKYCEAGRSRTVKMILPSLLMQMNVVL